MVKTSTLKHAWDTTIGDKAPFVFMSERFEGSVGPWSRGQVFDTIQDHLAEIETTADGFNKMNEVLARLSYQFTVLDALANYAFIELSLK